MLTGILFLSLTILVICIIITNLSVQFINYITILFWDENEVVVVRKVGLCVCTAVILDLYILDF